MHNKPNPTQYGRGDAPELMPGSTFQAMAVAAAKLRIGRLVAYGFALSLASNCLLGAALIMKKPVHQTILVPSPVFEPAPAGWTFDDKGPDENYLARYAVKLVSLCTNLTPASASGSIAGFLEHVAPHMQAETALQLEKEAEALRKDDGSTAFYPAETAVSRERLTVDVAGVFKTILGRTVVESKEKCFRLQFEYRAGRLWLATVREIPRIESGLPKKH